MRAVFRHAGGFTQQDFYEGQLNAASVTIRSSRLHRIATAPQRLPGGTTGASLVRRITTNPPGGKWHNGARALSYTRKPAEGRRCRALVNYVHQFHVKKKKKKNSPAREWLLAQLGAATASRQWENRAGSGGGERRVDPNADGECSVSHASRRARRLRCGYSATENLSEGWNFERKPSFLLFLKQFYFKKKPFIFQSVYFLRSTVYISCNVCTKLDTY